MSPCCTGIQEFSIFTCSRKVIFRWYFLCSEDNDASETVKRGKNWREHRADASTEEEVWLHTHIGASIFVRTLRHNAALNCNQRPRPQRCDSQIKCLQFAANTKAPHTEWGNVCVCVCSCMLQQLEQANLSTQALSPYLRYIIHFTPGKESLLVLKIPSAWQQRWCRVIRLMSECTSHRINYC